MLDLLWWNNLTNDWKQAFAETCFHHKNEPTLVELEQLYSAPAIRFAGPSAPFPNMSVELTDFSGIMALKNLQILILIHHQVKSLEDLASMFGLKKLFLYNNQINSLAGIEGLTDLEQLYVQFNNIDSINPVNTLVKLHEFYIHDNHITSLDGLTSEHSDNLEMFVCKPNDQLKQKEILRIERELGIRCRSV